MIMTIYFDMDGTLVDFYNVPNWLSYLENENVYPYAVAAPRVVCHTFTALIHSLQMKGYKVGIVTWLSKGGSPSYNKAVAHTKREYLRKHFPSIIWDEIHIVEYGTNKKAVVNDCGWLFDDEIGNRLDWGAGAFDVNNIEKVLREF